MTYCPHCNFHKAKSVYNLYTKKRLGNAVLFSSSQNWSACVISFDRKNKKLNSNKLTKRVHLSKNIVHLYTWQKMIQNYN